MTDIMKEEELKQQEQASIIQDKHNALESKKKQFWSKRIKYAILWGWM